MTTSIPNPVSALPDFDDPFAFFDVWYDEAKAAEPAYANAMTVASVDREGRPSARILLLKDKDDRGFTFYTNFNSRKAGELLATRQCALLFYWKSLERQIRIEGEVEEVTEAEADAYFATRPRGSQVGAWASQQSDVLPNGKPDLVAAVAEQTARFDGQDVPRPPHWSGFRLLPHRMEFWQDGEFRLHDRRQYDRNADGSWRAAILNP